jgi:ribosomal protein S18 acetylase RimI-like enzyme
MSPLVFSRAQIGESFEIAELVNSAYRGDSSRAGWTTEADLLGGQRTDPKSLAESIAEAEGYLLLARQQDSNGDPILVGCAHLKRLGEGRAYLGMLTVKPELQAAGLGRAFLAEAEKRVKSEWKATSLEMTVISKREELIAWYERRGYARTGESAPFPMSDPRFGIPKVSELEFVVLRKEL